MANTYEQLPGVLASFALARYRPQMPDPDLNKLTVATQEELAFSISHALQFNGRKQFDRARQLMADITALHLIERLRVSGYVVMKRPPAEQHSWSGEQAAALKAKKHLKE